MPLSDKIGDLQRLIIYNSHQVPLITDGELAPFCLIVISKVLIGCYSSFTRTNRPQLSEAFSTSFTAKGYAKADEITDVCIDLDDYNELFGSNASFVDYNDNVLC